MRCRAVVLVAGLATALAVTAASAAPKQQKRDPNTPSDTPMTKCMTEVGARWDAYGRRWWWVGGAGNPQEQAYYNCLERIAKGKRR